MNFEKVSFQRYLFSEGYLFVARSCRTGWFECWSRRSGSGDLVYQFDFKPYQNNFESAWDIVFANYKNGNILWQDDFRFD